MKGSICCTISNQNNLVLISHYSHSLIYSPIHARIYAQASTRTKEHRKTSTTHAGELTNTHTLAVHRSCASHVEIFCCLLTSADGHWEVPYGSIACIGHTGELRMAVQHVAGYTAVADLVAYIEARPVQDAFRRDARVSTRTALQF